MNRIAAHLTSLIALFGALGVAGCEVPTAGADPSPEAAPRRAIAQRQQGLTTLLKGKVSSFTYGLDVVPWVGANSGCAFQLDTYAGTDLYVSVDGTSQQGAASDGMCRLAFESLKSGSEISVSQDDGYVLRVSMAR